MVLRMPSPWSTLNPKTKAIQKCWGRYLSAGFPGAIIFDSHRKQLLVANIKGLPKTPKKQAGGQEGFNSHHYTGSLTITPLPESEDQLAKLSELVAKNVRRPAIAAAAQARVPIQ